MGEMRLTPKVMKKIERHAKSIADKRDSSHNFEHIKRAVRNAVYLAKKEKADVKICEAAALLHDIGQAKGLKGHELRSGVMTRKFLKKIGVDKKIIEHIVDAVQYHNTSSIHKARTKEAKIVFDADHLETIGPFGFSRLFYHRAFLDKMDLNECIEWARTKEKISFKNLKTKTAKKLMKKEHDAMERFYRKLR